MATTCPRCSSPNFIEKSAGSQIGAMVCIACKISFVPDKFQVLIVDQFSPTPSPYDLSQRPMRFDDLVALVMEQQERKPHWGPAPELKEVDDNYRIDFCRTAFRADAEGMAEVWQYRWDSSG